MNPENNDPKLDALLDFLKRNRGFDFSGYKRASLIRRIQKRMASVNLNNYSDYLDYLEVHPEEFTVLFNTILINVTGFFRDPASWDYLKEEIIPRIVAGKAPGDPIRVWSTGCASGEEAYSVAMLMVDALGEDAYRDRVKIYATDVDEDALNKARQAIYTEKEVEEVPPDYLEKYFIRTANVYSFSKELRRNLIFGRNDLIQDAPISHVDLLVCRNTLMYFNAETQAKILSRFHFAIRDNGFMFLGKAEMLLTHSNTFTPVNLKLRIFNKVPRVNLRDRLLNMAYTDNGEGMNSLYSLVRMRDAAFEATPVAQIVVDSNNVLMLANDLARGLFGLSTRDIGRPFQDLEISYRPVELRSSIQRAFTERMPVLLKDIDWPSPAGEARTFDVRVQPLIDTVNGEGVLGVDISFTDVTRHKALEYQLEQSNHELETALEELQSTNEELETTNEELQSTIEELETTNEELQSTNEELETMNEELQSTNEELQTINDELRLRTDELNRVNSFMGSILSSVQTGVVVMDRDLRVLVWNHKSEDLWGLHADEVTGQNFLTLDIGLPVDKLKKPLLACLSDGLDTQEVTLEARNRRGRIVQCNVRTSPLLSTEKAVTGVIAMVDIQDGGEKSK